MEIKYLKTLFSILGNNLHNANKLKNTDKIIQSSVSIIFKSNINYEYNRVFSFDKLFETNLNINNIEFLLIKRSDNINDIHSDQLAFPGGKCNEGEYDFETSQRETNEEIGIDLSNKNNFLYIGKIPKNFFAYYKNKKSYYVSVHIYFCLLPDKINFLLNKKEVQKIIWAPWKSIFEIKNYHKHINKNFPSNAFIKNLHFYYYFKKIFANNFIGKEYSCIYIENENFYGLSFYFIVYLIRIISDNNYYNNQLYTYHTLNNLRNFELILKKSLSYDMIYHQNQVFSDEKRYILKYLYYYLRMKQFYS